jgi:hypothetical protein
MTRTARRLATTAAAATLAAAAIGGVAPAQDPGPQPASPALEASVSPGEVTARTRVVEYRLRMTARADRDESFTIAVATPRYPRDRGVAGSPLEEIAIRQQGPGRIALTRVDPAFPAGTCITGAVGGTVRARAELPAGTTTTLVFSYRLLAPPSSGDLLVRFTAEGASFPEPATVTAGPDLRGRGQPALTLRSASVRRGVVTLRGKADPLLRGERIVLRAIRGDTFNDVELVARRRYRAVASARVRRSGTFVAVWRPKRPGAYLVAAWYPGGRRALPTFSCPARVLMRPAGGR